MANLASNTTVTRMRGIALQYGTTRGMLGCSIDHADRACAFFAMTSGYVVVVINGVESYSLWLREKPTAQTLWEVVCGHQLNLERKDAA